MVFNPIWWCMRSKLVVCNQVVGAITTIWRHLLLLPPSASLPSLPSPNWGQGSRCPGTRRPHATVAPPGNHMASWSPNCQALRRSGYPCDPHKYQTASFDGNPIPRSAPVQLVILDKESPPQCQGDVQIEQQGSNTNDLVRQMGDHLLVIEQPCQCATAAAAGSWWGQCRDRALHSEHKPPHP